MKTPSHHLSACLVPCLLVLAHTALAQTTNPSTLRQISVEGSDTHAVVTLDIESDGDGEGDRGRALPGTLEEIVTPPFRLFIDLPNVIPGVASATPVHKGGVDRVRVGLNQSSPPVTRVVLDLSRRSAYRLEVDPESHALRIIIGTPESSESPESLDTTGKMSVYNEYAKWFKRTAGQVDRLLSNADTDDSKADADAWEAIRAEVEAATPPLSLQLAHELLATAVRLGVVATLNDTAAGGRNPEAESASVGARLIATRARAIVRDASPRTAGVHEER